MTDVPSPTAQELHMTDVPSPTAQELHNTTRESSTTQNALEATLQCAMARWGCYGPRLVKSSMVAIAYEDSWYVGTVEKVSRQNALVMFFKEVPDGHFMLDSRDKQWVDTRFVLKDDIELVPASPRKFILNGRELIEHLYYNYCKKYF